MKSIEGVHAGLVTIIAPGPSVMNLRREHLRGPVIALYDAITYVERLDYFGPTYALQKDGCGGKCPSCEDTPSMVRPRLTTTTLLLHRPESGDCFADHPRRVVFDTHEDFGFPVGQWSNSAVCSVLLARHMGATSLRLVSFDSCTNGDVRTVESEAIVSYVQNTTAYPHACDGLKATSAGLPVEWVTPELPDAG